jgi:hypothetical protein
MNIFVPNDEERSIEVAFIEAALSPFGYLAAFYGYVVNVSLKKCDNFVT